MKTLVKYWRKKRQISLNYLTKLTGYNKGYLSQIENDKANPTMNVIQTIAHVLEVCPRELIKCDIDIECEKCIYNCRYFGGQNDKSSDL